MYIYDLKAQRGTMRRTGFDAWRNAVGRHRACTGVRFGRGMNTAVSAKMRQREAIRAVGSGRRTSFDMAVASDDREQWRKFASAEECTEAVKVTKAAMAVACDDDGDCGLLFPPNAPEAERVMGETGYALFQALQTRMKKAVEERYGSDVEHDNSQI